MSQITSKVWGETNQVPIYLFRMTNQSGAYVELTNYGATLVSIYVPDRSGQLGNVILSYPALESYLTDQNYLGPTIGRFANRIKNARFTLNGHEYALDENENGHANHSGRSGFSRRVFTPVVEADSLSFSLVSEDGDGGFPGKLNFTVVYSWSEANELTIDYRATSDQTTVANFTNHAYFNLTAGAKNILDHQLSVNAQLVVEAGADYIPTGRVIPVGQLAFDANEIGKKCTNDGTKRVGFNVCYVLDKPDGLFSSACQLLDPGSGRRVDVATTYPGLILYTGDYLSGTGPGAYEPFDGLCLECQYFPDSPNQPSFPTTTLHPGETYQHRIALKFTTVR